MSIREKLLNVEEVADFLGVHVRTVARLVADDKLPQPIKIGKLSRWQLASIEKAIGVAATA